MTRPGNTDQMPIIVFQLIAGISACIKRVLRHALLPCHTAIMLKPYRQIAMLTHKPVRHIAAMKIAATPGCTKSKTSHRLAPKTEQRRPPEVSEQAIHADLVRPVPQISNAQVPGRGRGAFRDGGANLVRTGILQDLITVNP